MFVTCHSKIKDCMKRIITCIAILITAFAQTQAQHPRVCDYVSLKHALKGLECEVITPSTFKDTLLLEHTIKEIKIKVIEKYGKSIDSLNIINYKNDTVYIYHEYDQKDFIAEIKTNKGAFRIYSHANKDILFEPFEIKTKQEIDKNKDPDPFDVNIYPDLFDWNGLEKLFLNNEMYVGGEEPINCMLTRLIFKDYKLEYINNWNFRPLIISLKNCHELNRKYGFTTDSILPTKTIIHIYDTISKINNDEYIYLMFEDENRLPERFKKGSAAVYLDDKVYPGLETNNINYLYEKPDTRSRKIYDLDKEVLIIYDIVGLWYYVKTTHPEKEKCYGWLKLHKTPTYLLNAEFYK